MKTAIGPIDREAQPGTLGGIFFDNCQTSFMARMLTGIANKAVTQTGLSVLLIAPRTIAIEQAITKWRPAQSPVIAGHTPGKLFVSLDFDSDLQTFTFASPGRLGSTKRLFDYMNQGSAFNLVMILFGNIVGQELHREMHWLRRQFGSTMIVATPGAPAISNITPGSMYDYVMEFREDPTPTPSCSLRVRMGKNSAIKPGTDGVWENLTPDPTGFWFSAIQTPQVLTLAQVEGRLYDLRSFEAQQKNGPEFQQLLKLWRGLKNATDRDRPKFL